METLGATFAVVPDPRAGNRRHELVEVMVIAFTATLCGAETCCDMALFGRAKEPLLRQVLRLPHGVPSHDTFSRVVRLIDPAAFESAFRRFTATVAERLSGMAGLVGRSGGDRRQAAGGRFRSGGTHVALLLVTAWGEMRP